MANKKNTTIDNTNTAIYNTEEMRRLIERAVIEAVKRTLKTVFSVSGNPDQPNLDNGTAQVQSASWTGGDTDMAKRIRRRVNIHGKTQWVTGNTEQEYAENLLLAMGGAVEEQEKPKHNFRQYADEWFRVFSKPSIDLTTAVTYERQLRLQIYPILGDMFVEDVRPADVQQIFNSMDAGKKEVAKETKKKVKTVLNMIFLQAIEDELILRNPLLSKSIRIKGAASKETQQYSVEQMKYIATDEFYLNYWVFLSLNTAIAYRQWLTE